jgi:uncharacterized protein (TIGR03792 family)
MVVEVLRFTVPPERRDDFIARDAEVWTPVLARRPGFIRKQTLADRLDPSRVVLLTHWETFEDWQAFPNELREQLDAQMRALYTGFALEAYDVCRDTQTA